MKLYSDYPGASITMSSDASLQALLKRVLHEEKIERVVETGTYRGLGSTTLVAEAFATDSLPQSFVTIEANYVSWLKARDNLARFPFVMPVWGLSVRLDEALAFLNADECLSDHSRWPEIFIDDIVNPLAFYSAEVCGQLGGGASATERDEYRGEDLLRLELRAASGKHLLVVLDSAGGIGFLEFSILRSVCAKRPYLVLLDDIHHLKHFRSFEAIRSDPHFTLLGFDLAHGWVLARHLP